MFCPKCGTENSEANKYCRACREDLELIAQALKKRLPVLLVSKLDAALERLSERFRRDSILLLVFGIGMLIAAAIDFRWRPTSWSGKFELFAAAMGFLYSGWSFLLYKRSLTHGERLESGEFVSGSLGTELRILFCPACGTKAETSLKHCRACGADLGSMRSAVKPSRWRLALNALLDKHIRLQSNKLKIKENVRQLLFLPFIYLAMGIMNLFQDRNPIWFLFSILFFVIVFWDRAAARRWFPAEKTPSKNASVQAISGHESSAVVNAPTTNELSLPAAQPGPSVIEATTRQLEPVSKEDAVNTRQL